MQKNKNRAASSKEVQALAAPADHLSYDHVEGDYFPSYFEVGPSGASDTTCHCEGGQSLSPPQTTTSARATTTLLIEDRRHETDELAEVRAPVKTAGDGV